MGTFEIYHRKVRIGTLYTEGNHNKYAPIPYQRLFHRDIAAAKNLDNFSGHSLLYQPVKKCPRFPELTSQRIEVQTDNIIMIPAE